MSQHGVPHAVWPGAIRHFMESEHHPLVGRAGIDGEYKIVRESHIQSYEVHEEARGAWPKEQQLPGFRWVPAFAAALGLPLTLSVGEPWGWHTTSWIVLRCLVPLAMLLTMHQPHLHQPRWLD